MLGTENAKGSQDYVAVLCQETVSVIFSVVSEVTAIYAPNPMTEQKHCQSNIIT